MRRRSGTGRLGVLLCMLAGALVAEPGAAQDVSGRPDDLKIGGDRVSVGVGLAVAPSYIGSNDTVILPTAAIQGQVSGISFNTSGTALYVDLVPSKGKPGWKLEAGPLVALRLDRNAGMKDASVAALGTRKKAVELGGSIGLQRTGVVTSDYDTLSLSLSYSHDVAGAHRSYIVSPEIDYDTPLSERAFVSLSLSADYVGKRFGAYYYDIDAAGAAASGLRAYSGAARSGWKDWNISMMAVRSLTGNLTHGFGIFAAGAYQRLRGAYRRSPIVSEAGTPNQWTGALGLEYTF